VVDLKNIAYISSAGFRAPLIANRATIGSQGKFALCALLRNPITGTAGCCARAASGHAAAPITPAPQRR
jgi:hypothetical protein